MTPASSPSTASAAPAGFRPPAYPYDRLAPLGDVAASLEGGVVDLSVGTPTDPPPEAAMRALAEADAGGAARGYPPSVGGRALLEAISAWIDRRFGVTVAPGQVGVCVGTKEFVATLPRWLALRAPGRDTVLFPAVAYPTYAMGAELAGLRAVPVPLDAEFRLDLGAIGEEDAGRALVLWVNSPGNPAGQLDDLEAAADWGRRHGVLVASDECYADFTWAGPVRTVLAAGTPGLGGSGAPAGPDRFAGVLAVHSLSKRSNLAGLRLGWYAGDAELVEYLREVRKHAGMMVPGPVQRAGIAALGDEDHVEAQRRRYRARLEQMAGILAAIAVSAPLPGGGFYLWAAAPGGDAWALTDRLARQGGALVSPGEFYGAAGRGHVRVAMVQPQERLDLVARRLGV